MSRLLAIKRRFDESVGAPELGSGVAWSLLRLAFIVGLLALFVTDSISFADGGARTEFLAGIGVFGLSSLLVGALRAHIRAQGIRWAWPPFVLDVLAISLLVAATDAGYEDPFFPIMLGLVIYYALLTRSGWLWAPGLYAGVGYLGAHLLGHHGSMDLSNPLYVGLKAATIPVLGYAMGVWMDMQARREGRLTSSRDEIARLNDELTRRIAELHIVSEITELIHSSLDFDTIGPMVIDSLVKAIDIPTCSLFVVDESKGETVFSASRGVSETSLSELRDGYDVGEGLAGPTGEETILTCTNVLEHGDMAVVFCAPVAELQGLSEDDRLVLQAVASELVVAIENSMLYRLTKKLSITDELTGLYNYRLLRERLEQEFERANRYNRYLSLLMIDADHFKKYNDSHGHLAGDRALMEIADVLKTCVREVDVLVRYGGEEFAVLLPETDAAGAFVVAEKIREAVAAHQFVGEEGERGERITVSVGVATFPIHALGREELLKRADNALYEAKQFGRDRVRASTAVGEPSETQAV